MTTVAPVPVPVQVITYLHTDGLGSPVARTNEAGSLISRTRYEPYGATAAGATPDIGFTGHVNDADTGLVYMQARYYDPVAGRFMSIDPVTTDTNTGNSFNRYYYANNNPYRYIDPDGRDARDDQINRDLNKNFDRCAGGAYCSTGTSNAENPGYDSRMAFKPYAETMGQVFETGLEWYTEGMLFVMPEVAGAEAIAARFGVKAAAEIVVHSPVPEIGAITVRTTGNATRIGGRRGSLA